MAEIVDFGLQQHKIKMDSRYFENVLSVVAGDTGRRIEVQLLDTNGMVQDTTGLSLRLNAEIAGKATFTDATLVDATTGKYQLDLSNGMFLAPGNWQFQWLITDSAGKKLHSFAFTGNVGSNISEGGSQATNFYLNLEDLKEMQYDMRISNDGKVYNSAGDYLRDLEKIMEIETTVVNEPQINTVYDFFNVPDTGGVSGSSPYRAWGIKLKPMPITANKIKVKINTINVTAGAKLVVEVRESLNGVLLAKGTSDLSKTQNYCDVSFDKDVSFANGAVVSVVQTFEGSVIVTPVIRSTTKDINIDTSSDVGVYFNTSDAIDANLDPAGSTHNGFLFQLLQVGNAQVNRVITNVKPQLVNIGKTLVVAKSGSKYNTVQSAINDAINGDTVLIYPGLYKEQIHASDKEINLVGISKQNTIIYDDSSMYDTPPLEMAAGMVKGLTIIEDHSNPTITDPSNNYWERAYSIHIDFPFSEGRKLIIDDCIIRNSKRCALGIGTYQDFELIIQNCDIWMGMPTREQFKTSGALYFHNRYVSANTTNQKIRVINTTVNTDGEYSVNMQNTTMVDYVSELEVEFINSTFYSKVNGKESIRGTFNSSIKLSPTSHGNNIAMLNA